MTADAEQKAMGDKKRRMSGGERLFDFIVYGPVAFLGSFALSAGLAVLQKRKAPFIHETVVDAFKKIRIPGKIADASAPILLTSLGGTLMIAPIKWAEDRKQALVKSFNTFLGEKDASQSAEVAPKQTWGSLVAGRAAVIALTWPIMSVVNALVGKSLEKAELATGNLVARRMKQPTHKNLPPELPQQLAAIEKQLDAMPRGMAKAITDPLEKQKTHLTRAIEKYETISFTTGRMLAVDAIVTVGAVIALYFTSHFFARRAAEKHKAEEAAQKPITVNMPETPVAAQAETPPRSFKARLDEQQPAAAERGA